MDYQRTMHGIFHIREIQSRDTPAKHIDGDLGSHLEVISQRVNTGISVKYIETWPWFDAKNLSWF